MTAIQPIAVALVEDDEALREATHQALTLEGFDVIPFADAVEALEAIDIEFPGVVVTDIRMPRVDGLELFARLAERDPELPVILVTGHGDVPMAVEAMRNGAADFLTKPFATSALADAVRRAASRRALVIENRRLRDVLRDLTTAGLLGTSDAIRRLDNLVTEVARTDIDVRVVGGPGTGKSHLARRIHELSARADRPFVTIDVGVWTNPDAELVVFGRDRAGGLSRSGLVERARGGTLFLDDAETIPETLRGRVRTLLEQRTFRTLGAERPQSIDLRVIGAVSAGGGGDSSPIDHLGGVTIGIPALADRREDIAIIFRQFVDRFERELATVAPPVSAEEWRFLLRHDWPNGLREVRDFARAFVLGLNRLGEVPGSPAASSAGLRDMVANFEKAVIEDALRGAGGRIERVQDMLSLPRKTLYDKLARHGLNPKDFR